MVFQDSGLEAEVERSQGPSTDEGDVAEKSMRRVLVAGAAGTHHIGRATKTASATGTFFAEIHMGGKTDLWIVLNTSTRPP